MNEALEAEFDTTAAWTVEAVEALGPDYALAAACRGSGTPAGLAWLAESMRIRPGTAVLDAGAGVGGPASWLRDHYGADVLLADPMPAAVAAARRLFGLNGVVAWSQSLPIRSATVDAAWCLGVLDTVPDRTGKLALLRELNRVLRPGSPVGLLVLLRECDDLTEVPEGNDFPSPTELAGLLDDAGFAAVQQVRTAELPPAPVDWQSRADRVDAEIASRHHESPTWQLADKQASLIRRLLSNRDVVPHLLHTVTV